MNYATIYDMRTGYSVADGINPDAALFVARRTAEVNGSVIVEDHSTGDVYRVTPSGKKWKAPKCWTDTHD